MASDSSQSIPGVNTPDIQATADPRLAYLDATDQWNILQSRCGITRGQFLTQPEVRARVLELQGELAVFQYLGSAAAFPGQNSTQATMHPDMNSDMNSNMQPFASTGAETTSRIYPDSTWHPSSSGMAPVAPMGPSMEPGMNLDPNLTSAPGTILSTASPTELDTLPDVDHLDVPVASATPTDSPAPNAVVTGAPTSTLDRRICVTCGHTAATVLQLKYVQPATT
ncbi:hypothetical protein F5X68DRAFT_235496 [Plectosphaerella plurivora]|uniref:Uncharacterized protein n=1 Tax=Plectosphaerella plurivora TaxID=936078 RepID=A0A9P9A8T4_9PEZI|nr:hypothetical protein F5X68DRAFT_235496 [Plectosphaerella plurivora]